LEEWSTSHRWPATPGRIAFTITTTATVLGAVAPRVALAVAPAVTMTETIRGPVAPTVAPMLATSTRCDPDLVQSLGRSVALAAEFPVAPSSGLVRAIALTVDLVQPLIQRREEAGQPSITDAWLADMRAPCTSDVPTNIPTNQRKGQKSRRLLRCGEQKCCIALSTEVSLFMLVTVLGNVPASVPAMRKVASFRRPVCGGSARLLVPA
jgi:hypothetical protein